MSFHIILLGPPGAGKGTQAEIITKSLGVAHISSGDLFRENMKEQTELGARAKSYIDRGALVPDEITIEMVRERLQKGDCAKGVLLDGFPRTVAQAIALGDMLGKLGGRVDQVFYISVPADILVARLGGRWTCKAQGHVFHEEFNPPRQSGLCDYDGSALYQRDDDKVETVTNRINVFLNQTAPLVDYYAQQGVLKKIDGTLSIEKVTQQIEQHLSGMEV